MREFNILNFSKACKRQRVLQLISSKIIYDADLRDLVDLQEMNNFLSKIQKVYIESVQYHNDLHGADVMQMGYYFLTTCKLRQALKLNKLDCLSFLMAAVCHDLGHDGFTNSYHVNAITKRAIKSNDKSVQESFHASKMFKLLNQQNYNFTKDFSKEEFKIFR